jgi:hypothetical protein
MNQVRQDIRARPWAAALVVALCVAAGAFAFGIRVQAGDEWVLLGLLMTTPVLSLAAALVWLRRDIRAHPLAAALALAGLAGTWGYAAATRSAGGGAALWAGVALNMLLEGTVAALVCRARGGGAAGLRGGLLAAMLLSALSFAALVLGYTLADWLAAGHYPVGMGEGGGWLGWLGEGVGMYAILSGIPALLAGLFGVVLGMGDRPESAPAPPVSVG